MTKQALDLEEDWQALRTVPRNQVATPQSPPADLESDWATLKNLPETVYVARSAIGQFSLWEMSVVGQKRVQKGMRHSQDCWLVTNGQLLFYWGDSDNPQRSDGRYAIPKNECDSTFEAAAKRFAKFREVHLESLQRDALNCERQIQAMLNEIKRIKGKLVSLRKVDLSPEITERDNTRRSLLSVFGQRVDRLKLREDLQDILGLGDFDPKHPMDV